MVIAVLIQFYQLFPLFRFPLHSPLPEPLFFRTFNLVKLLLCIIAPSSCKSLAAVTAST